MSRAVPGSKTRSVEAKVELSRARERTAAELAVKSVGRVEWDIISRWERGTRCGSERVTSRPVGLFNKYHRTSALRNNAPSTESAAGGKWDT